jgi:fluoride exporter
VAVNTHESDFFGGHRWFHWIGTALPALWLGIPTSGQTLVSGWDLAVNVLGCLVIGLLGGIAEQRRIFAPEFRLFVFIGILGGFTTFSAFADETAYLVHSGHGAAALLNIALQVMVALFAVWLGGLLARFA